MTIIHFVKGSEANNIPHIFLNEMIADATTEMSFHLLLSQPYTSQSCLPANFIHKLPKGIGLLFKGHKYFDNIIEQEHPDVIHLHSICGITSWLIFKWARKKRIPVVVSPHKSLMDWNFRHNYFTSKLPQFLFMQRSILKYAAAILCVTAQEFERMKRFSVNPWKSASTPYNKNLDFIPLVNIPHDDTKAEQIKHDCIKLYRKVIDSNPFWLMSDEDRQLEDFLISLGIAISKDIPLERTYLPVSDIIERMNQISTEAWRLIQLHCQDQGVLHLVINAAKSISPNIQILNIQEVDRFSENKELPFLETAHAQIRVSRMKNLASDYRQYENEKKLCVMMLNTKYLYNRKQLSRRNLADLYAAFRYSQYDEYILEAMLDELSIHKFTSRILYILHTTLNLDEGFVPINMLNDWRTRKIEKKLFKSNIQ